MKQSVIMKRELNGSMVRQDSKTKMFNANDLCLAYNESKGLTGRKGKRLDKYFDLDSTSELISKVCMDEMIPERMVKISRRGGGGGTWVHPIIMLDLAMWLSVDFKYKALKWVLDGLIDMRNESGDTFRESMAELATAFPNEASKPDYFPRVARYIYRCCGVSGNDKWETATEDQIKLRNMIHRNVIVLADVSKDTATCLYDSVRKARQSLNKTKMIK